MSEGRPIPLSITLKHYKRIEIQKAMVESARSREVAVRFGTGFGKRPDVLNHPRDIIEFAKSGATSFHVSEERWTNPLQISADLHPKDLEAMRSGWDLVLDIDCHFLEYSKIAAKVCIDCIKSHGIESVSVKFSGNKGFHIGVPFESFPKKVSNRDVKELFPDAPRRIAMYIRDLIAKPLSNAIMNFESRDLSAIMKKTGTKEKDVVRFETDSMGTKVPVLDATPFLDIDTILISSRHLYRMPYSLHEKSQLVSIPIDPESVTFFDIESAKPEIVQPSKFIFLDASKAQPEEARSLFIQAFDHIPAVEEIERSLFDKPKEYVMPEEAIPPQFFPPCIRKMLMGLKDGRKRAVFVLVGFLPNVGWEWDKIEEFLKEWNKRNDPPMRDNVILSQIRYRKAQTRMLMPPNFENKNYYDDMGCPPSDPLELKVKNPVNYAKIKAKSHLENSRKTRGRKPKKPESDSKETPKPALH